MGADRTGPWGEDPADGEAPPSERPYGTRPYGTRPYGTRPYGTRPYGTRPYGTRPYGTRPYGTRPYGTRPYGTRPYGTRDDMPEGGFDPDEWSEDTAELFCQKSAVVRLGASLASDGNEIPVPAVQPTTDEDGVPNEAELPRYLDQPDTTAPGEPMASEEKPAAGVSQQRLRPRDHELAWKVVIPNRLARDVAENQDLAWALKDDISTGLALVADQAFLRGAGGAAPLGVSGTVAALGAPPADLLLTFRAMVSELRRRPRTLFRNAGWIVHPATLDELAEFLTTNRQDNDPDGQSVDSTRLLRLDGHDGGILLGYPFVATPAAGDDAGNGIYFASDWTEAWVGVDRDLVRVDVSTESHFQTDETVVRAVMHHDFLVRRPTLFIHTDVAAGGLA
jgi:Phage capsid family